MLIADVLDWTRLNALRELQAEDEPDVVAQVIEMFREDAPARLARARAALARGDRAALALEGHSIRGTAGVIGASALREVAGAVEREANAEDFAAAGVQVDAMARAIDDVLAALANGPASR
jgi:HPt (histidine-containing phosphotransfer) domain-containing protein